MTSRYISLRPDNVNPDATISFKAGFPVLSFTIQSQAAILDPRSIRINGELSVFKDLLGISTPAYTDDVAPRVMMDNRLGIFAMWDQLVIRHNKSKQICEHIRHYNRYLNSYLGVTSSVQDMVGHLNETCLIQPNPESMYQNVVASSTTAQGNALAGTTKGNIPKKFSCHLPSGFMMSGNSINLLENSFGGIQIEIHLSPDSNCLFTDNGTIAALPGATGDMHYQLKNLSLTCEVFDIPVDQMSQMMSQSSGALEFNTISSLYTSINTSNAQLQYNLGLRNLQSVFMTFTPSKNINTLVENGLATVYPSNDDVDDPMCAFNRIQFLRGGQKYPVDFDMTGNSATRYPLNSNIAGANGKHFNISDSQLAKQFAEAIIPEYMLDRTSLSNRNLNRNYSMDAGFDGKGVITPDYKTLPEGGALFGLGMRYSQFNKGQDFSTQQWGCSLESDLTTDNPQSVFLFFKAKAVLSWDSNNIQLMT